MTTALLLTGSLLTQREGRRLKEESGYVSGL